MSAVWFMAFADRSCSFEQDVREISRFSCMLFLSVRGFSDYAGPNSHSRNSVAAVLPSSISEGSRHPDPSAFRSSIARPTGTSGLRFTRHLTVPPARLEARMESLFSFPVGLFHPLQHAGLSRRTPDSRPPCKSFVKGEKDSPDARLGRARTIEAIRTRSSHVCLSAVVSCLRRTGHPFTVSGPCVPSQKIECVFSASPETIRREPREFDLRRSVGNRRTWQSARWVILLFFRRGGPRFLGRYAPRICERYEIALPPIHGEQISHHLPSHRQRRSIGISFLLFSFIDQGQIMILSGCQLRGFHQHTLDMFVALFGKRGAHHLFGRALFITAEPAVTDGFSDRGETRNLSHFQCPGQRRDRSYSRNGPEAFDSLRQQRVPL